MKILIIEDDADMIDNISQSLQEQDYRVEVAHNYFEAIDKVVMYTYDCILLDLTLPDGDGLDVLQEIKKQEKKENVIIISARDQIDDKVKGLEWGADDYLTKPFHLAELNARIKSVIRRNNFSGDNFVTISNVKIDTYNRMVWVNEQPIELYRKEFDILIYLVSNQNRLVRKSSIAEHVWGDHYDEADDYEFMYAQIRNLRKKLTTAQADIEIQSVYGLGYKLIVL